MKHIADSPALPYIMNMSEINAEFLGQAARGGCVHVCGSVLTPPTPACERCLRPVPVLEARAFLTSIVPKGVKAPSPFYSLFSPLSGDGLEHEVETVATQVCVGDGDIHCPSAPAPLLLSPAATNDHLPDHAVLWPAASPTSRGGRTSLRRSA